VGIVLSVGADRALSTLTVESDLPGFTAEVRRCDETECESSTPMAGEKEAGDVTTWELDGADARYVMLWITALAEDVDGKQRAHVNEVTASS
jgi:hypothetical protein